MALAEFRGNGIKRVADAGFGDALSDMDAVGGEVGWFIREMRRLGPAVIDVVTRPGELGREP